MSTHALVRDRSKYVPRLPAQEMPDSAEPGVLWAWLERTLADTYGIRGMFYITYPVGDSAGSLSEMMDRAVWKITYPSDYLEALGGNLLDNHRSALIVLETGRMCLWNDPAVLKGASPAELKRLELDARYAMDVGVCLPLHTFSGRICGGFGLRSHDLPADAFYASVVESEDELTGLLARFDARFRGPFACEAFHITRQEKRVLAHVAGGLSVARTAHELKLSPKTVEFYLRGIREKTRSASTAEAVAKAIFFSMI